MIIIKNVYWLDKETNEAEVLVSDGKYDILCFAHPFKYHTKTIENILYAFEPKNIQLSVIENFHIHNIQDTFKHQIIGKLLDKEKGIITVGDFIIEIDNNLIPKDINNEDYISFECERIDIW